MASTYRQIFEKLVTSEFTTVISPEERKDLIAKANKIRKTVDDLLLHLGAKADDKTIKLIVGQLTDIIDNLQDDLLEFWTRRANEERKNII